MTEAAALALASIYLARGLWRAHGEVRLCRAEARRTGPRPPLWPVWLAVTALWPVFDAQRAVGWALTLWDAAAARRADRREVRRG
ncbi:MAG: hypothetical protein IPK75_01500 [Acidobacteria bacterium]|nr:hypothetical protein [Acidobacteriota bacterium]